MYQGCILTHMSSASDSLTVSLIGANSLITWLKRENLLFVYSNDKLNLDNIKISQINKSNFFKTSSFFHND